MALGFSSRAMRCQFDPILWANSNLAFSPDPQPAEVLASTSPRLILCRTCQWGKSTVTVLRNPTSCAIRAGSGDRPGPGGPPHIGVRLPGALHQGEMDFRAQMSAAPFMMPTPLIEALLRHRQVQAQARYEAADGWVDSGLVATSHLGTPLEPRAVGKRFDEALRSIGLPHCKVHTLRHTAAAILLSLKYTLAQVQQSLGHS